MKQVISIALLMSIFIAILGLDVGIHKCGGELKSVAFFGPATPCAHAVAADSQKDLPPCHRHLFKDSEESDSKGCCEDEYHDLQVLEIEVIPDHSQWSAFNDMEFATWDVEITDPEFTFQYVTPEYLNYKPPLISGVTYKLIQVFLI